MTDLPPGFALVPGIMSGILPAPEHQIDLLAPLDLEQRSIRIFGRDVLEPRLTAWLGPASYTYSGVRRDPAPMTYIINAIRMKAELEISDRLGLTLERVGFNSCLVNHYRNGRDSVAWHADDEPELGPEPVIASVSVGASRAFHVRARAGGPTHRLELAHGDLLVMWGRSQADYMHSVPKRASGGPRTNLTFRRIYAK